MASIFIQFSISEIVKIQNKQKVWDIYIYIHIDREFAPGYYSQKDLIKGGASLKASHIYKVYNTTTITSTGRKIGN